jgi:hypothetical protein
VEKVDWLRTVRSRRVADFVNFGLKPEVHKESVCLVLGLAGQALAHNQFRAGGHEQSDEHGAHDAGSSS